MILLTKSASLKLIVSNDLFLESNNWSESMDRRNGCLPACWRPCHWGRSNSICTDEWKQCECIMIKYDYMHVNYLEVYNVLSTIVTWCFYWLNQYTFSGKVTILFYTGRTCFMHAAPITDKCTTYCSCAF